MNCSMLNGEIHLEIMDSHVFQRRQVLMLSLMRPILEKVMKRDASVLGHMIRDDFYSKICA